MKNSTDFSPCFKTPEQQVLWVTVIHINLSLFLIMVKAFKMPQNCSSTPWASARLHPHWIVVKLPIMVCLWCFYLCGPRGWCTKNKKGRKYWKISNEKFHKTIQKLKCSKSKSFRNLKFIQFWEIKLQITGTFLEILINA